LKGIVRAEVVRLYMIGTIGLVSDRFDRE